ncbi:MAG: hypothetical protein K0S09_2423 [Sphingobacteriaceae bacterium]|nr:hypothetical protein [Sphingobacteriaceae bacterium]
MQGMSGKVNRQLLAKYYKQSGKTVISKIPDMSRVKFNAAQKRAQENHKEALIRRTAILKDPALRAEWEARCPSHRRLCDFVLSELMLGRG